MNTHPALDIKRLTGSCKMLWSELLYRTGALRVLKGVLLRGKTVVLMYHRVLTEAERERTFSPAGIIVTVDTFARHLRMLRTAFRVIGVDEFVARLDTSGQLRTTSCLITFDDGWLDNYHNAYPILRRHQMPAVIFLPADFIGTDKVFWREAASAALYAASRDPRERGAALLETFGLEQTAVETPGEAKRRIERFLTALKGADPAQRDTALAVIADFAATLPVDARQIDGFMNWRHVREMSRDGISFGAHGYHHHILTSLSIDEATRDVIRSRDALARVFGAPPQTFCYPNGDFNQDIARIVADAGFSAAFSVQEGLVGDGDDRFALRRVGIHEDMTRTQAMFLARILGAI